MHDLYITQIYRPTAIFPLPTDYSMCPSSFSFTPGALDKVTFGKLEHYGCSRSSKLVRTDDLYVTSN